MIKQITLKAHQLFSSYSLFTLTPRYLFTTKLSKYTSIKKRNLDRIKKRKTQLVSLQSQQSQQTALSPQFHKQFISTTFGKLKCQGCSASLQSKFLQRYGYIDEKVLSQYIKHNTNSIQHQIQKSDINYQALREVQEELGIKILDPNARRLEQINDIDVLLKIEEKIEALNVERQTLVQKQYKRKELYCRRCYYLKYHNQLPDEHNSAHNIITDTNTEQLLKKIFSKKEPNYYFYLVDSFDMCGTLTKEVVEGLCNTQRQFTILMTKSDVVNKKYLNYVGIKPAVRDRLGQLIKELKDEGKINYKYNYQNYLQDIFMLSNQNLEGITKVKKKIEGLNINVQLIGYPNTGKTSLLNHLTSLKKPTSTVPGTSLSFQVGKFNNIKIFDCPGFYNNTSLYNLIRNPNERKKMTWKEPKFAPGILTNTVIFFGGMLQIEGVRVVIFGHGGAKAVKPENANEWLLNNYEMIWNGLPEISYMGMQRYEFDLEFVNGQTDDLEIAGYGFIGFKLCKIGKNIKEKQRKKLTLFLPQNIEFNFRKTLVLSKEVHNPTSVKNRFQLNSSLKIENQPSEL